MTLMLINTRVMRYSHLRVYFYFMTNQQLSCNMRYFLFNGLISSHHQMWELFLEKYEKFLQSRFFLPVSWVLKVLSWNISKFLILWLDSSITPKCKKLFQEWVFFIFWSRKGCSWNTMYKQIYEARKFPFRKYK